MANELFLKLYTNNSLKSNVISRRAGHFVELAV